MQLRKRSLEAIDSYVAAMLRRGAGAVVKRESNDFCSVRCRNHVFTPERRQNCRLLLDNIPIIPAIKSQEFKKESLY